MPFTIDSIRRRFLKSVGGGGSVLLAGQLGQTEEDDDETGSGYDADHDGLDPAQETTVDRIAADSTDIPDPIDRDEPTRHEISISTEEHVAEIEPGATFHYMTFEGRYRAR